MSNEDEMYSVNEFSEDEEDSFHSFLNDDSSVENYDDESFYTAMEGSTFQGEGGKKRRREDISDSEDEKMSTDEDIMSDEDIEVAERVFNTLIEVDRETYERESFTPKQLAKMYKKIANSFIFLNKEQGKKILEYFCVIKENPTIALPTLLWIDTFHDFKDKRVSSDRNKIIDYLCFRLNKGKHFLNIKSSIPKSKDSYRVYPELKTKVPHNYTISNLYQTSFFIFDKFYNVKGFDKDVKYTVLKECLNYKNKEYLAKLLYDVSTILINRSKAFESDFLNAYLIFNFNFDISNPKNTIEQLKFISWNQISSDKISHYAKDVDKGSGNFLRGNEIIIPASLFDANTSNSSSDKKDFVNIPKTIIPLANGYDFVYDYTENNCNLILGYSNKERTYQLTTLSTSSCGDYEEVDVDEDEDEDDGEPREEIKKLKKENDENGEVLDVDKHGILDYREESVKVDGEWIKSKGGVYLVNWKKSKKYNYEPTWEPRSNLSTPLIENTLDFYIKSLSGLITRPILYNKSGDSKVNKQIQRIMYLIDNLKIYLELEDKKDLYVSLDGKIGISPVDITTKIITILINKLKTKENISCKELDFWISLKRIGDFGQILQCKQLNVPIFTDDQMQILLSLASSTSVVWTLDRSKVVWYNNEQDAFMCNNNATISGKYSTTEMCNIQRKNITTYQDIINEQLLMGKSNRQNLLYENYINDALKKATDYRNKTEVTEKLAKIDISMGCDKK